MSLKPMTKSAVFTFSAAIVVAVVVYFLLPQPAMQGKGDATELLVASEQPALPHEAIAERNRGLLGMDECETPAASPLLMSVQMDQAIDDYLQLLVESGRSELEISLVRDLATITGVREQTPPGFDALGSRPSTREGAERRWTTPPSAGRLLTGLERQSLAEAFEKDGVSGVLSMAGGDPARLHARWGDETLLGHLIGRDSSQFGRLSHSELSELSLGVHELAAAVAHSSAADFRTLLSAASVSSSDVGELARIAALEGRPETLRELVHFGADLAQGGRSILDDLAATLRSGTSGRKAQYLDVVEQLVAAGDRPYLPSSVAMIDFRLPEAEVLTLHESTVTAAGSAPVQEAASGFVALLQDWSNRVDAAAAKAETCAARPRLASSAQSPSQSAGIVQRLNYQRELAKGVEQSAGHREAGRLFSGLEDALKASLESGELEPWRLETAENMVDLAYSGQWRQAVAAAEELQAFYPTLLEIALSQGAPAGVIAELVGQTGRLPDDAVMTVVSRSLNLKAWSGADEMMRYLADTAGLDLHYVDPTGHNAVTRAAEYFYDIPNLDQVNGDAFRVVKYLVDQSVTVKPTTQGLDALDRVLLKVVKTPETLGAGIGFLRYLVDRGAPVESSHRQLAGMLRTRDPASYTQLVDAVPELRASNI